MSDFKSLFRSAMNPAGGLFYHQRALKFSTHLWAPFREEVSQWLKDWAPLERSLILVGPSGGYCLDLAWLSRFDRIIALEPDPLARKILDRRRMKLKEQERLKFEWCKDDVFGLRSEYPDLSHWRGLLYEHPQAAILFSNFLGQVRFLTRLNDDRFQQWQQQLVETLANRTWASFHDRLSGALKPQTLQAWSPPERKTNQELAAHFFAPEQKGTLFDHLTFNILGGDLSARYFLWRITPTRNHIVEGTYTNLTQ